MKKLSFYDQKNVISHALKVCRVKENLTQAELAAKMQTLGINLDQQMISKIENNTRIVTDYELASFCLALHIKLEDLLADFYKKYAEKC